jgi:hypothetical protein
MRLVPILLLLLTGCHTFEQSEIEREQVEIQELRENCETKNIVLERGTRAPRGGAITLETTVVHPGCGRAGIVVRERN